MESAFFIKVYRENRNQKQSIINQYKLKSVFYFQQKIVNQNP